MMLPFPCTRVGRTATHPAHSQASLAMADALGGVKHRVQRRPVAYPSMRSVRRCEAATCTALKGVIHAEPLQNLSAAQVRFYPGHYAVPAWGPVRLSTLDHWAPQATNIHTNADVRAREESKRIERRERSAATHERAAGKLVRSPNGWRPPGGM